MSDLGRYARKLLQARDQFLLLAWIFQQVAVVAEQLTDA